MSGLEVGQLTLLFGLCFLAATAALLVMGFVIGRDPKAMGKATGPEHVSGRESAFGARAIAAMDTKRRLLSGAGVAGMLAGTGGTAQTFAQSGDSDDPLFFQHDGGSDRQNGPQFALDPVIRDSQAMAADTSPILTLRRSAAGAVLWANKAYVDMVQVIAPDRANEWPLPDLFSAILPPALPAVAATRRGSFEDPDGVRHWFDVFPNPTEEGLIIHATPIDSTIRAETSLRNFLQTLTGTFAHLRCGLAIFDKRRQLVIFNPAIIDLLGLQPDWLATRPLLGELFDRLRDRNMLPEPKNYRAWRNRIAAVESAASGEGFEETWTLPSGQIYRITARPHHDQGIALIVEDISQEVALTRQFRSELELSQAVIDALDDAIVVFSKSGLQVMANTAYARLWNSPPDAADDRSVPTVREASTIWQAQCRPAPLWGEIRDFVMSQDLRAEWSDQVRTRDGALLGCRVIPLKGGVTLVAFSAAEQIPVFKPSRAMVAFA